MVLVSISTYARRRVHVCVDGKCFAQKGKAPVTDAFPLIFSDAEQLALLRRELLLGEHAGVQQRFQVELVARQPDQRLHGQYARVTVDRRLLGILRDRVLVLEMVRVTEAAAPPWLVWVR